MLFVLKGLVVLYYGIEKRFWNSCFVVLCGWHEPGKGIQRSFGYIQREKPWESSANHQANGG